jgi:inhibitor of cysteine peptidase
MKRIASIILAAAFLLVVAATASVCDNAPCEKVTNAVVGEDFTITLESNAGSTGYEWWTKFDPAYLTLVNSIEKVKEESSGMVGVPGEKSFTFNAKKAGSTEIILLQLQPWENGSIGARKIFPVIIA